ncbi:MAG: hypothetical protein M1828_004141 [Chrysothrix sp. TS-e1954]|nr:MAG: hypothetical protein M1828_004141 [Chrysothrix sp. TS-e1954]
MPSSALHNSLSSISSSQALPDITRTYKQSSQLFLTRRVAEALESLQPIIERPAQQPDDTTPHNTAEDSDPDQSETQPPQAPIATASRGARVKVWSLYISILNAVVEMGQEAGKDAFGAARWRALCAKARDGGAWEEVQRNGYYDQEGDVDADVVANLATLMLAHAPSQRVTQQKLEAYLAAVQNPLLDVSGHMARSGKTNGHAHQNGTSTPRDLSSRLKILEIYTLHVLPRNEEWEYAREFINMSEILDEERKEAFLHALQGIQDERSLDDKKEGELQKQREQQKEEARRKQESARTQQQSDVEKLRKNAVAAKEKDRPPVKASESEHGVSEKRGAADAKESPGKAAAPNGSATTPKATSHTQNSSKQSSRPSEANKKAKSSSSSGLYKRAMILGGSMQQTILAMAQNLRAHPVMLIRMLAFLIALVMAFARRDVRDRLDRIREASWDKIKRTVGMGVKVSYI